MRVRIGFVMVVLSMMCLSAHAATTGFNDATGIHGDTVVDGSPYLEGEALEGAGAGELGWLGTWAGDGHTGAATIQSAIKQEGDLALEFNSGPSSGASVFIREGTEEYSSGSAQLDVYFYANDRSNGQNTSVYLMNIGGPQAALVTIQVDGSIDARDGPVNSGTNTDFQVFPNGTVADDTWYKLSIIADVDAQTFQVALDDVLAAPTMNFRNDLAMDGLGLNAVRFWNKANSFVVDNINLVPEPGTMSLMAFGLVGLFVRVRRRV